MNRLNEEKIALLSDLSGPNLGYLIDQFERYKKDPMSVEAEMREFLEEINESDFSTSPKVVSAVSDPTTVTNRKIIAAAKLAENIRTYGHLSANIYPLGREQPSDQSYLETEHYGLSEADLITLPAEYLCSNRTLAGKTALEACEYLKTVYTKSIAYEFDHVHVVEEKNWLIERIEVENGLFSIPRNKRIKTLKRLFEVEGFEKYLHKTFVGQKRFSIEGLDVMVPIIDEMISEAVQAGAEYINLGMAHRGRLNVLAHVLGKPYEMILAEFQHAPNKELVPSEGSIGINFGWTGDVKYHLGLNRQLDGENTVKVKVSLANNPSHLEYVGAVVEGSTRAAQDDRQRPGYPAEDSKKALAILIHGDAAFPGEGIVAETLNLSRLKGYRTGGTIHIIANNRIGFTTESKDSRSTRYASDLAKGFEIPILHVNADDPDACLAASHLAAQYRAVFQKDFLIDLVGYRRFGHNEMDEPMTTNPQMYSIIHGHPTVKEIYSNHLKNEGITNDTELAAMDKEVHESLEAAYQKVSKLPKNTEVDIPQPPPYTHEEEAIDTRVSLEKLQKINNELLDWPKDFEIFNKLEKILNKRAETFREKGKADWSLAETLAFATILADGIPIRLSGQDTERGTYAQRNLVIHDRKTGVTFSPLHRLSDARASFAIYNSPLTEAAAVGFEYGYSVFSSETLVIWEAQYGDFANAAQVIFDQFIAAGRAKWGQKSGIVLLLPHGYEGQGPEHSSARLERFLQLAAERNWTIANLTSAANYFHILRRQAAMLMKDVVRPLVIMTPKSLLRNPLVPSDVTELSGGKFKPVIEQFTVERPNDQVKRIVLCSGKIAIDLAEQIKDESQFSWLQIVRVEEIYPFPKAILIERFKEYSNVKEIFWVQEEPKNMGAWTFVEPRINAIAPNGIKAEFIGRRRRSSPAEGEPNIHKLVQSKILRAALTLEEKGGVSHG
ncbi:2-oxoglutarate dehydrogenase E1 component [Bacillus sp. EB600]|uniref:2-oxoglutarate dehydrogenase E1 component n=1 Tax=Bacillus sp. EB600 TaxID=2806345 RepID=UPI00210AAEFB|nr:2-oxoglutarate dehydrogenase E1 component [Bacillus sp. EB600]MCQ6282652.1 2-oxoglutarate dehydrogenase E1 component [Bacillus sp. EB600]